MPTTEEEWRKISHEYFAKWNFPICIGALDRKRVLLEKPTNSGSQYYGYKGHYSMILLALVDADYSSLYVDVGACGRASEEGVWDRCSLKAAVESEQNILNIPQADKFPFSDKQCPYLIVGDDAFPLKPHLMKPYPGRNQTIEERIFDYRLSRARRTSENAFGIMSARFQVLRTAIRTSADKAKDITLAAVVLHNYLRSTSRDSYAPPDIVDTKNLSRGEIREGRWRQQPHGGIERLPVVARGHCTEAKQVRNLLQP